MSSSIWQSANLFPYFLGITETLDISNISDYSSTLDYIKWTNSYPRKINAEKWMSETSASLYDYSNGTAYLEEDCNSVYTPEFGVYGRNKVYPFIVVCNNGSKTLFRKFIYDPESPQKFHHIST